jgi:hypothetical protein
MLIYIFQVYPDKPIHKVYVYQHSYHYWTGNTVDVKKYIFTEIYKYWCKEIHTSSNPYFRQIEPLHSPPWQTWVPSLQGVRFGRGLGVGHCAVVPLQKEVWLHSVSCLHKTLVCWTKWQDWSQHGPSYNSL